MQYADIVAKVKQRAGISEQRAAAVTTATVQALVEQVSSRQSHRLAEQLPIELKRVVDATAADGRPRSLEDFAMRVSELSGVHVDEARSASKAVVATLAEAVSRDLLKDVFDELPPTLYDLLPVPGPRPTTEEFLARVQDGGGIASGAEAERAVHATLRTLADRISGGQAQDLAVYLPAEVRADLVSSREQAEAFDLETFLDRVANLESTDTGTAERHARAVFAAVRASVPEREVIDTLEQLPSDIGRLSR